MTEEEKAAQEQELFNKFKDTETYRNALNAHGKLYHEQHKGDVFKAAQGEAYGHVDKLLLDILEVKRENNAPTTGTLKPILEEYKLLKANQGNEGANNEALEALKKQHALDIQGQQSLLKERDDKIAALQADSIKRDITEGLGKALRGKTFKAHYSPSDIEGLTTLKFSKILNSAKIEDGKEVFYNADGSKRISTKTGLNMTAQEVIDEDFADMFEVRTGGGNADPNNPQNGNNNNANNAASFENDKVVMNMKLVKSRDDFYKSFILLMRKKGISEGTGKFDKLYREAMSEYDYNALPST